MSNDRKERDFDIVVFGATGYTGQLIAEYLSSYQAEDEKFQLKWAIAGRSKQKLESIRSSLTSSNEEPDILIGVLDDSSSLIDITRRTRCLISAVGPYSLYGEPLVSACVETGTDYTDVTGEIPFMKKMIDRYDKLAAEKKMIILSFCGFDSLPSDLGCLYNIQQHKKIYPNNPVEHVQGYISFQGGSKVSGGTLATIYNMMSSSEFNESMKYPYCLNLPTDKKKYLLSPTRSVEKDQLFPRYSSDLQAWTGAFPMASGNTRIVRRSASFFELNGESYSDKFSYYETLSLRKKSKIISFFKSLAVTIFIILFGILAIIPFTRRILQRFSPQPGTAHGGKDPKSSFTFDFYSHSTNKGKDIGVVTRVSGPEAYIVTAILVCETALLLAKPNSRKKIAAKGVGYGSVAYLMGEELIEILNRKPNGMKFEIIKKSIN